MDTASSNLALREKGPRDFFLFLPKTMPNSGIQTAPSGEQRIPQSVRADGSLRKEIKIRPGYRPPEDVEVYKNRTAEAWKNRGKGGVPGADEARADDVSKEAPRGKNAKRRETRKKAKASETTENQNANSEDSVNRDRAIPPKKKLSLEPELSSVNEGAGSEGLRPNNMALLEEENTDLELEKEKQARNIKKKLRQAKELKEKKELGESLLPEQLAKVIKIQELVRQLDTLGLGSDAARKPDTPR